VKLPIFSSDDPRIITAYSNGPSTRGSHRLSEFKRCLRAWFFRQMQGLVPKRTRSYFVEGSTLHLLLAYHYGAKLHMRGIEQSWLQVPCDVRLAEVTRGDAAIAQTALRAYNAYRQHYADETLVPTTIEHEYWARVGDLRALVGGGPQPPMPGDDEQVSARIDLTAEDKGLVWFLDYKFLAPRGAHFPALNPAYSDYVQSWQFFVQTAIGMLTFGARFGGVILQRVGKGGTHPMARDVVPSLWGIHSEMPGVLGRLLHEEAMTAQAIWSAAEAGTLPDEWLPPPSLWACQDCDYWQLCASSDPERRRTVAVGQFAVEE